MAMKLLDLYTSILKTANLTVSDDGYISMEIAGNKAPALIDEKRLVLPTQEHLLNPSKDKVIFHPLSENILRNESKVFEKFRSAMVMKINYTIGVLAYQLLTIATSVKDQSKLKPDQTEFLTKVKNADEKTLQVLGKLMAAMPANQTQKAFVSIYVKRGGVVEGRKHSRSAIVSFPLYEELTKATTEAYGVKLRVKDKEVLINLLEYMLPNISVKEFYNKGSDSDVAPFLDALMNSVKNIASPLNDIIELFNDVLEDHESLRFEDEWVETFENLAVMIPEIRKIPMQAGNEGVSVGTPAQPVQPAQPAQPATPVWLALPQQQFQPAPFYQSAPQPVPMKTERGLDFQSVLNSNPVLARAVGGPVSYMPMQNNEPRWAQPSNPWNPQPFGGGFGSGFRSGGF